jgi:hypothetical protein
MWRTAMWNSYPLWNPTQRSTPRSKCSHSRLNNTPNRWSGCIYSCCATGFKGTVGICVYWKITWVSHTPRRYSCPARQTRSSRRGIYLRWVRGWQMRWSNTYSHSVRYSAYRKYHLLAIP